MTSSTSSRDLSSGHVSLATAEIEPNLTRSSRWWAFPLAIAAGLVTFLAFPPVGWAPAAVLGTGLLILALLRASVRRGFVLGFLAGLSIFLPLLHWMTVVGWDAWLLLSAFCALWIGTAGSAIALVTRLPGWPWWVAGVWVAQETLRGRVPFGGFPWGRLAYSQPDSGLGRLAYLIGQPGVSFAAVLLAAALIAGLLAYRRRDTRSALAWVLLGAALIGGSYLIRLPVTGDFVDGAPTAVISAVQGGTPQTGMGAMDVRRAVLTNHVRQTLELGRQVRQGETPQPAFVLWPENASDIDPFTDPAAAAVISGAARAVDAPILVGAVVDVPDNPAGIWNLGVVWDPVGGPGERYVKTHPVPFGEYIPFREVLTGFIGRFDRIPRDFIPGEVPGNLLIGGVQVGDVICFEVAYDDVISRVIDGGARVLTVQTNNATYQGSAQPTQQLFIERMRAIETGRSVIVAATSGISAMIRPDGSVAASIEEGSVGALTMEAQLRGEPSPSARIGAPAEILMLLLGLGPVLWAASTLAPSRNVDGPRRRVNA